MDFEKLTRQYLKSFQIVCKTTYNEGTKSSEMASRPIVHGYIDNLIQMLKRKNSEVIVHHDMHYTRKERPDWRIEDKDTYGIFCFGDHKNLRLGRSFELTKSERTQLSRYISFGRPVFIFDGIEFLFFKPNQEQPIRKQLVNKTSIHFDIDWSIQSINPAIELLFREILENPGFRKWTETELIEQLALRCRTIADELSFLLSAPLNSGTSLNEESLISSLHNLKRIIVDHHDASLRSDSACADFIAQVLTFGLFYAHTRFTATTLSPQDKSEQIRRFWNMSSLDKHAAKLRPFKAIIDVLSEPLKQNNALSDWYNEILGVLAHAEYMGTNQGPQDFHSLFEKFLTKFDEKSRFDRGAFYTPKILSDWVARASNSLSLHSFGIPIISAATNIIDPCCGTGSFLESIKLLTGDKILDKNKLIGFEILPAPYALSHYRLSQIYSEAELSNISILLTDTLSDLLYEYTDNEQNGFSRELQEAIESCDLPLRLVIGNPPSSNHPVNSSSRVIIENMMNDFRPPIEDRTERQNIQKALNNEAYRFLRWCGARVIEAERGILSLILPGALSDAISFKYVRKWLLNNFDKIYVIELDADARRGDVTHSLFSVLQGRLALIASRNRESNIGEVFYLSISNYTLEHKNQFLQSEINLSAFKKVNPSMPDWRFKPGGTYPKELWDKCVPIISKKGISIFESKCSAIKLAPTAALFHTNKPTLIRRAYELSGKQKSLSTSQVIKRWFEGQRKPPAQKKFTEAVKQSLSNLSQDKDLAAYLFRPFLNGWIIENDVLFSALSQAPGGGTRARPEIRKAFSEGAVGIAMAPSPVDLGSTLTRFSCFCWNLPDNDIAARGNAMIYCDKFPKKLKGTIGSTLNNINTNILKYFEEDKDPARAVLYYVYAILSSKSYLNKFEGALYRPSDPDHPPRIPIALSKVDRYAICQLGEKIAECENPKIMIPLNSVIIAEWPSDLEDFQLLKFSYDESKQEISLLSDRKVIKINGVSPDVLNLVISGHNVVDKWIRERTYNYLRRNFNNDDLLELHSLLSRIIQQQTLLADVDVIIEKIINHESIVEF
ncbi:type ISP restriction/modification enzyme [Legionella pneumophila serogroup 1]